MPALKNQKHEAFAQAIANGSSGVQAYRDNVAEAGSKTNTCMTQASILLRDPKVSERVQELQKLAESTLEKKLQWNKEKALSYLVEVLETPVGELTDQHRLTNEVTYELRGGAKGKLKRGLQDEGNEEYAEEVEVVKLKGISKADAMKQLSTMCGWNEPEKIDASLEIVIKKL